MFDLFYLGAVGFSVAWLLTFTKSFRSPVCRVVGFFVKTNVQTQTGDAKDLANVKSHAREKPLLTRSICVIDFFMA